MSSWPSRRDEELHAENANVVERLEHLARDVDRLALQRLRDIRRRDGYVEDVPDVRVLDRLERGDLAAHAACRHDGNLALQIDERLENRFRPAERRPRRRDISLRRSARDRHLPFAVVAERRGLEDGRQPHLLERVRHVSIGANRRKRRHRKPAVAQECFLAKTMLRDLQRAAVGTDDGVGLGHVGRCGGHVLELERDNVDTARELANLVEVVVWRHDLHVGNLSGRRVVLGRERVHAVAETPRRHGEHASELAAAEHANRRAGIDDARDHDSESRRTASAISAR